MTGSTKRTPVRGPISLVFMALLSVSRLGTRPASHTQWTLMGLPELSAGWTKEPTQPTTPGELHTKAGTYAHAPAPPDTLLRAHPLGLSARWAKGAAQPTIVRGPRPYRGVVKSATRRR